MDCGKHFRSLSDVPFARSRNTASVSFWCPLLLVFITIVGTTSNPSEAAVGSLPDHDEDNALCVIDDFPRLREKVHARRHEKAIALRTPTPTFQLGDRMQYEL